MVESSYLASTFVTGLLLVIIAVALLRMRDWQHYTVPAVGGKGATWTGEPNTAQSRFTAPAWMREQGLWMAIFFLLSLLFGAGVLLFVGFSALPEAIQMNAGLLIAASFGAVIATYLFSGVYSSLRSRGRGSSWAAVVGLWAIGALVLVAIVAILIFS